MKEGFRQLDYAGKTLALNQLQVEATQEGLQDDEQQGSSKLSKQGNKVSLSSTVIITPGYGVL